MSKEEQEKKAADAAKAKREQEIGHQLSFLKNVLNPKISDDALLAKWLEFRAVVGDP